MFLNFLTEIANSQFVLVWMSQVGSASRWSQENAASVDFAASFRQAWWITAQAELGDSTGWTGGRAGLVDAYVCPNSGVSLAGLPSKGRM